MSLTSLFRVLLFSGVSACTAVQASPLSDLAEQAGVTWMIGNWATADGAAKMSFEWRLEKQAIATRLSLRDRESEGTIALKPGTTEAGMFTVDSRGAVSMGRWSEYEGQPLLKSTIRSERGEMKLATRYIKIDHDTLQVKVHRQNDAGEPGEFLMEAELKRVK